jgi:hypothetical protein
MIRALEPLLQQTIAMIASIDPADKQILADAKSLLARVQANEDVTHEICALTQEINAHPTLGSKSVQSADPAMLTPA